MKAIVPERSDAEHRAGMRFAKTLDSATKSGFGERRKGGALREDGQPMSQRRPTMF